MPLVNGKFEPLALPPKHLRVLTDRSKKWRFRVLRGSRNGAKDWSSIAQAVEMMVRADVRFLFTREVQKTLAASAHQLIQDTIDRLGYKAYFTVTANKIASNINGSFVIFNGLNDLVADDLKSLEGIDIAVICEAEKLTKKSFDKLNFTIRKPNSEIWIIYNTRYDDDFVYEFTVKDPPENMICELVNGFAVSDAGVVIPADNPWISPEQLIEAQRMYVTDRSAFNNQCLGQPLGQGGKVWTAWDDRPYELGGLVRTIPWEDVRKQANCFCAMDPHSKYFPFLVWGAVFPDHEGTFDEPTVWIYNEWPTWDMFNAYYSDVRKEKFISEWGTLLDFAKAALKMDMFDDHGIKVLRRFIDTRFDIGAGGENWATQTTGMVSELRKPTNGGLDFISPPTKFIDIQREVILTAMRKPSPLTETTAWNTARMFVAPHCKNLRQSLCNHRLEEDSEKESERYKDPSDALRILYAGIKMQKYAKPGATQRAADVPVYIGGSNQQSTGWMA